MSIYPILQSGFISLTKEGLTKPELIEPTLSQVIIFKEYKLSLTKYFYSAEVGALFNRWLANPKVIKDFDFRERVIMTAFRSFGDKSFVKWIELQNNQSTISDVHKAFLYQTLEYITTGLPRTVGVSQWSRIIEAESEARNVILDVEQFFNRTPNTGKVPVPGDLCGIIQKWVSLEGGYEDLLVSLFVIFGERSRRSISNGGK